MSATEFSLIQKYFAKDGLNFSSSNVSLSIGDDCAILEVAADEQLVLSIDTQVEGIHFPIGADPELIAQRALRCAISDLAAMAAAPVAFTLAITLPNADEPWLSSFSAGLLAVAQQFQIPLIGGDTTKGPLTISIQVHGKVKKGQAVKRSGAVVGDLICVTGCLGDASAALKVIQEKSTHERGEVSGSLTQAQQNYLASRFYKPEPRLAFARAIAEQSTAMIDLSDGLLGDIGHICKASGVGARLTLERMPISSEFKAVYFQHKESLEVELAPAKLAAYFGDDYELCFTVSPKEYNVVQEKAGLQGLSVTVVGEVVAEKMPMVEAFYNDAPVNFEKSGYSHF